MWYAGDTEVGLYWFSFGQSGDFIEEASKQYLPDVDRLSPPRVPESSGESKIRTCHFKHEGLKLGQPLAAS